MATERAQVFEVTQIGIESTFGTAVAATKRLLGTTIVPSVMSESTTHRARGSRFLNSAVQNKEWTEAEIAADVAQYTDSTYLKANMLGAPSITTPGGGTNSREHLWETLNFTALTPKPFTVENGSFVRAERFAYGLIRTLGMEYTRDGVSLSGNMFGQKTTQGHTLSVGTNEVQTISDTPTVSGGTFTITFMGETTSAIAYNATAGAIQTALEALANVDAGDVVVTGGPNPATDVVLTFGGKYASVNLPLAVLGVGSLTGGGTYSIAQTTAGAALSELALQPISGDEWDFYLDTTGAGVGGTKLTRVHRCSWNIADLYGPYWVGNTSNPSWVAHVDLAPTTEVRFTVQKDATGAGLITPLQTGDKRFVRFKATGPIIEGALNYLSQQDFCVVITGIGQDEDDQGVVAIEYTAEIAYDSTWGKALSLLDRNTITAIA